MAAMALVSACASAKDDSSVVARLPVDSVWKPDDYKYQLGPGDELGLRFLLTPDLNSQVTIGPDGRGVFPMISGIKLSGLTVEEANATLSTAYKAYLRQPVVELLIYNYLGGQVYIAGEIKNPGARTIHGDTSIIQAIEDVGGFLPTAKVDRVVLLRRRSGTRVLMKVVNVNAILTGRSTEDVRLLPGDVIFVPRSTIAEVDRVVQQYITGALPFSTNYQLNTQGVVSSVVK